MYKESYKIVFQNVEEDYEKTGVKKNRQNELSSISPYIMKI